MDSTLRGDTCEQKMMSLLEAMEKAHYGQVAMTAK